MVMWIAIQTHTFLKDVLILRSEAGAQNRFYPPDYLRSAWVNGREKPTLWRGGISSRDKKVRGMESRKRENRIPPALEHVDQRGRKNIDASRDYNAISHTEGEGRSRGLAISL